MTLELCSLTKHYGKNVAALSDVSLQSSDHEFIAIVGPSGCGKTTLLRIVAGLEQADSGEILIDENSIKNLPPRDRDVAMVFQGESLYPHLTVRENLAFPLRMRKRPSEQRDSLVESTANQLGVADLLNRMPNTLSGGERQRVALGRALVREPKVFLMDEPFSHLDAHLRRQLRNELMRLRQGGTARTLFVTHDQREAMLLGDRVAIMDAGRIHQFGTPDQIRESPATDFVRDFVTNEF